MAAKVQYETATLADAIGKAARVAPTKGEAFDKAAGILLEVSQGGTVIKSTNLETTYRQEIPNVSFQGTPAAWRVSTTVLPGLLASLPMGSGSECVLASKDDGLVQLRSGRTKGRLQLIAGPLPDVEQVDPAGTVEASEFASKVEQVSWACERSKAGSVASGVHVDGTKLWATNMYLLCSVPCTVGVQDPVTVPLSAMATMLRNATDVRVKAEHNRLKIILDPESCATSLILASPWPDTSRVVRRNFTGSLRFGKSNFGDTLASLMVLARQDRSPRLRVHAERGQMLPTLTLDLESDSGERVASSIDVDLAPNAVDDYEFWINPTYLGQAVERARGDIIKLDYGHPSQPIATVQVSDDKGYECHIMCIKPS